jgi:hypothetical protein
VGLREGLIKERKGKEKRKTKLVGKKERKHNVQTEVKKTEEKQRMEERKTKNKKDSLRTGCRNVNESSVCTQHDAVAPIYTSLPTHINHPLCLSTAADKSDGLLTPPTAADVTVHSTPLIMAGRRSKVSSRGTDSPPPPHKLRRVSYYRICYWVRHAVKPGYKGFPRDLTCFLF